MTFPHAYNATHAERGAPGSCDEFTLVKGASGYGISGKSCVSLTTRAREPYQAGTVILGRGSKNKKHCDDAHQVRSSSLFEMGITHVGLRTKTSIDPLNTEKKIR